MKTGSTAAANPAALHLRKSLLACFATKQQGNHVALGSIAALAAPIHRVPLIDLGQIRMLARQVGDPMPPKIGFGFWEWGTLRPESVAGK